jgi:hypothetical protein
MNPCESLNFELLLHIIPSIAFCTRRLGEKNEKAETRVDTVVWVVLSGCCIGFGRMPFSYRFRARAKTTPSFDCVCNSTEEGGKMIQYQPSQV